MGFSCAPTAKGVQMTYTLNAPASVDVVVRNIAGRVVKRVYQSRQTPAGEAVVTWTGQADNGLAAPNGAYVVEIVAKSPEGERTGLLRTVYYHR
jgi:flagellar hook assembly protein FlgD